MACPNCGCKVLYPYDDGEDDMNGSSEIYEICASCGKVFDILDLFDDDDEP